MRNERGVALLIVLLVTALLIALIFEFAYATRISLNSAVNFRDSQRAYFLARSGIRAFITYGTELRGFVPQGEWHPVPIISEGDTQVMIKWEDESGKIKISDIKKDSRTKATEKIVRNLFEEVNGMDQAVVAGIVADDSDISNVTLLSGLQKYISDEDFYKVADSLTVTPEVSLNQVSININTASKDVLLSLGISAFEAERIIEERKENPYTAQDLGSEGNARLSRVISDLQSNLDMNPIKTESSGYYKVYAHATVGEYTKQVEAILKDKTILYWRAL